ncbi:adenylate/guanylate cyclase domain-containing protein, partial [Candidatus Gracilibacteria bacterium]
NTGRIVHGNLGARGKRLNYTIIGDDVNLASRLESVNKIYGTSIIVSESVYNKVSNDFVFRELDHVLVKGKNKAVFIYELVGYKNQDYDKETLFNYSKGLKEYYLANYEKASEYFGLNKDDLASTYMIKRIKRILRGELKIIDGIYKMEKK